MVVNEICSWHSMIWWILTSAKHHGEYCVMVDVLLMGDRHCGARKLVSVGNTSLHRNTFYISTDRELQLSRPKLMI
jgi:hypothetical protein